MQLIRRGDRGTHVLDVQRRLARLGLPIPPDERAGDFGEGTQLAVAAFQQDRGLMVDGIVGEETWRVLVEASWKLGDRVLYLRAPHLAGDDVRELQDKLGTFGFDVGRIDGIYGPRTDRALREFQRNYGLPPDGVVAEHTVRAMRGLPSFAGDTPGASLRERESMRSRPLGLTGLRVVLDPGHGGDDAGFVSSGVREADLCFRIARLVEANIAAAGAQVFLTRYEDNCPTDSERAALANALDAETFISIHLGPEEEKGAAAFYFGHARYRSEAGSHLAKLMLEEICATGLGDGGIHPKTVSVLRETRMPAVFVEAGSIARVGDEGDPPLARIAAAIGDGLRRFTEMGATA